MWHRIYFPWLPRLPRLREELSQKDIESGEKASTTLLLALLSAIALDVPSQAIAAHRHLQPDLRRIVYSVGQKVVFTLPRYENTVTSLELLYAYSALALVNNQQEAAHALNGHLYATLTMTMQQRLGFDSAPEDLRQSLNSGAYHNVGKQMMDTLRWCTSLENLMDMEQEEVEMTRSEGYIPALKLEEALAALQEAIDRDLSPPELIGPAQILRYHFDDLLAVRDLTIDWRDTTGLSRHITAHTQRREQSKKEFELRLMHYFYDQGRFEAALALGQVVNMEFNYGRTAVVGLSVFYTVLSGVSFVGIDEERRNPVQRLSRSYTDRLNKEMNEDSWTGIRAFIDTYADVHIDKVEQRLTDFINLASDVTLNGVPFIGHTRRISLAILLASKEMVENNATRLKRDGGLHPRADVQLILLQEAARRLEGMEAGDDKVEAIAKGSIVAASAKLIRGLHRIMWQWKTKSPGVSRPNDNFKQPAHAESLYETAMPSSTEAFQGLTDTENLFLDGMLAEWTNWPQFDPMDVSSLFGHGYDPLVE